MGVLIENRETNYRLYAKHFKDGGFQENAHAAAPILFFSYLSIIIEVPIPPPMQSVARPYLESLLIIS